MGLFSFLTRKKEQKEDLNKGLEKTKTNVFSRISKAIMGKSTVDDEVLDNLEEIIDRIQARVARDKYVGTNELNRILKEEIMALLQENESGDGTTFEIPADKKPYVIMVVGVNGVGKTTTIGKLAHNFKKAGKKVVLGASDTFRAAAVSQLQIWAERVGVPIVQQGQGADPASVAFDTVKSAVAQDADVVIIDTAGRLAEDDPKAMREHIDRAARTLKSSRDELRNCLWDLRSRTFEERDMKEAIERAVAPHAGDAKIGRHRRDVLPRRHVPQSQRDKQ